MTSDQPKRWNFMLAAMLVIAMLIPAACVAPTPQIVQQTVPVEKVGTQVVEKQVTQVVEKPVVVTATPAPKKAIKIEILWWGDQMTDANNQIAQEYNKLHPDFQVSFVKTDQAAYTLQFQTWFQSKMAPVLMGGGGMSPDNAIKPGYLTPWDPYLELPDPYAGGKAWKDTLHTEWMVRARYEGDNKVYTLPTWADQAGIYFNKSIYDKLGLKTPTTWDGWMANNQKLKDAGYDAMQIGGNVVWMQGEIMDATWREHAAEMLKDPNYTKVDLNNTFDDTRTTPRINWAYCSYKEAILKPDSPQTHFMTDKMLQLASFFPKGTPELESYGNAKLDPILLSFVNARLASWYGAGWMLPALNKLTADLPADKRFEVGYFTLPGWGDKPIKAPGYDFMLPPLRPATGRDPSNANFVLSAQASEEDRLRAVDFIMYFFSPQSYSNLIKKTDIGSFPMTKDVPDLPAAMQNPPKFGPAILTQAYTVGSGGEEFYIRNVELFYQAANGEITPDQYVQNYAKLWADSIAAFEKKEKDAGRPLDCKK
jgi:ABC-type glycerol-3-phosphate transport system substrate-binding protein